MYGQKLGGYQDLSKCQNMNQKKLSHLSDLYKLTFHNNTIFIVLFLSFLHLQKFVTLKEIYLKK
jgi:hypothetical protein